MKQLKENILFFYEKYIILLGSAGHLIFVFQAYEIFNQASARGVSFSGFLVAFISIISWLFYGLLKSDKALIIVNIFGFIMSLMCLIVILNYR